MVSIRWGTWIIFAILAALGYEFVSSSLPLAIVLLIADYFVSSRAFYYIRLYTTKVMCFDVNGVLVYGDFKKERLKAMPGIYELLENLKQTHVLVVIGNNNEIMAEGMHKGKGFDKFFDHHFQSSMFGVMKPDPQYFIAVAKRIGVSTKRMVFADDDAKNVVGAKKAGLAAFQFTTTEKYRKDLESIGI